MQFSIITHLNPFFHFPNPLYVIFTNIIDAIDAEKEAKELAQLFKLVDMER